VYSAAGLRGRLPTPEVRTIRDTTGAGDSFNAGYLAARLLGLDPEASCGFGQQVAGEVIGHFGALAPQEALGAFRQWLRKHAAPP